MSDAIFYRSTDTSAPVLTRQVGSLITLLKAILVDGYGTQPSLGWTVEYEDVGNKICVFRMPAGTRMYIQINDNAPSAYYNIARIQAYKTMSSAYLGIEPCPPSALAAASIPCLVKEITNSNSSTPIPWELIGDDKGFWWIPYYYYITGGGSFTIGNCCHAQPCYIGDYIPFNITNVYNFCIICPMPSTIGSSFSCPTINSAGYMTNSYYALRDCDFSFGTVQCGVGNANQAYIGMSVWQGTTPLPSISPVNGRHIGVPIYIHTACNYLGILPGILGAMQRWPVSYVLTVADVTPTVYTDGTNKQLVVCSTGNSWWNRYDYVGKQLYNSGDKFRYVY